MTFSYKLLQLIDQFACLAASPLLVHSEDMRNTILSRPFDKTPKISLLNNFSVASEQEPYKSDKPYNLNVDSNVICI